MITGWPNIRAWLEDSWSKSKVRPRFHRRARPIREQIVHLLNLNVQRLSWFEGRVNPAADVRLQIRVPFAAKSVETMRVAVPKQRRTGSLQVRAGKPKRLF